MVSPERSGQLVLDGIVPPDTLDMKQQYSFAHVAQPQYWGVESRFLEVGDYEDIERVAPDRLESDLLSRNTNRSCGVWYRDEFGQRLHVALTPKEYGLITRNAEKIGEASLNKTIASRPVRANFEADTAAAHRSAGYTLTTYIEKMERYTTETLEVDINMLDRFSEYVSNPQLRRLRGDNFRMQVAWLQDHVFGDTIMALRMQRRWKPEQEQQARRALEARLFLDRADNKHLKNWDEMLALERKYWGHKWALFKTKTLEAKRYVRNNG